MFCGIPVEEHCSGVNNKLQNNIKAMCETPKRGSLVPPPNQWCTGSGFWRPIREDIENYLDWIG